VYYRWTWRPCSLWKSIWQDKCWWIDSQFVNPVRRSSILKSLSSHSDFDEAWRTCSYHSNYWSNDEKMTTVSTILLVGRSSNPFCARVRFFSLFVRAWMCIKGLVLCAYALRVCVRTGRCACGYSCEYVYLCIYACVHVCVWGEGVGVWVRACVCVFVRARVCGRIRRADACVYLLGVHLFLVKAHVVIGWLDYSLWGEPGCCFWTFTVKDNIGALFACLVNGQSYLKNNNHHRTGQVYGDKYALLGDVMTKHWAPK